MNHDGNRIRGPHVALMVLMLLAPLAGPGSHTIVLAAAAAVTAYEGLRSRVVYSVLSALVFVELVYGLDVGVLSLSYVGVVLLLSSVRRVIAIAPWTSSGGWQLTDAVRILIVACGFFAFMTASTVIFGHYLYGYSDMGTRMLVVFSPPGLIWTPVALAVILIILRRIDEPFHRPITFGI